MKKRLAVVTGSSSGIGLHTALGLARQGWSVVMVSRDAARAEQARALVQGVAAGGEIVSLPADLSARAEVLRVTEALKEQPPIDVLVNCAGAFYGSHRLSADGVELTWALDHLAPYILTLSLLDRFAAPGRVVNVSSRLHEKGVIQLVERDSRRAFSPLKAYAQAKLANLLFTYECARRLDPARLTINAVHPGDVHTNAARNTNLLIRGLYRIVAPLLFLTPEKGADTVLWAATAPELAGVTGKYFHRRKEERSSPLSHDAELARRVWRETEEQTGIQASFDR
jgi:NAD(P)-dependent dehydrogenase (short-subunit alcohol dehydrogenase family)